jgi:hypothetical protein
MTNTQTIRQVEMKLRKAIEQGASNEKIDELEIELEARYDEAEAARRIDNASIYAS